MTQKLFHEKWEKGLTAYLGKLDETRTFGSTRDHKNGDSAEHGYIIDLRDVEVISRFNVLGSEKFKEDFEKLIGKPHTLARHLNSSQVMCYNFFRPMISDVDTKSRWRNVSGALVKFVKETLGVSITEKAVCQFEYEDSKTKKTFKKYAKYKGRGENSQFDFFVQDGETKIFFEIKFTESSFGAWSTSKISEHGIINHCAYVEKGYKGMVERSPFLTQECKDTILSFNEEKFADRRNPFNLQYQLFRNALKADANTYSVFIFPDANPKPQKEFKAFKNNLIDGQDHIIALKWEDLKSYMSPEFFEKYIKIFEES